MNFNHVCIQEKNTLSTRSGLGIEKLGGKGLVSYSGEMLKTLSESN